MWCMCVCTKRETKNEDITRVEKTCTYTYSHTHTHMHNKSRRTRQTSVGPTAALLKANVVVAACQLRLCRDFGLCRDGFFSVRSLRCADAARVNVYTSPALRTNGFKNAVDRCEYTHTRHNRLVDLREVNNNAHH